MVYDALSYDYNLTSLPVSQTNNFRSLSIRHGAKYIEMYLSTSTWSFFQVQVQIHTLPIQVPSDVLKYKYMHYA